MACAFTKQDNGQYLVTITDLVPEYGLKSNDEVSFRISRGLKTPISTKTTSSFQIAFLDSDRNEINFIKKSMSLTMRDGCDIGPLDVTAESSIVGAST
jgi:hypothetical protein